MDVVYICRDGDNEELRYSIRSIVKNLPFDNIWVVGGRPDWYSGNHITVIPGNGKYDNARNNLRAICDSADISESFVLMNDDFYILKKIKEVPYTHGGLLSDRIKEYKELNSYSRMLIQTWNSLDKKLKRPILNYELHTPMIMEKSKLKKILDFPGLWRSSYGNLYDVGGIQMADVKVYHDSSKRNDSFDYKNNKLIFLSSEDMSFELLKRDVLDKKFKLPSLYENG